MIVVCCLLSILAAWSTFRLVKIPAVTPTRASTSLSLIGFLLLYGLRKFYIFDLDFFSLLIFGATFVGMSSHKTFSDLQVMLGALIFGILFNYTEPHSFGIGGALGFCAFVSVLVVWPLSSRWVPKYLG